MHLLTWRHIFQNNIFADFNSISLGGSLNVELSRRSCNNADCCRRVRAFKVFNDLILESRGTRTACIKLTLITAIVLTGTFLSIREVNGKLPPLPNWNRPEMITSLIAGPDGKACNLASALAWLKNLFYPSPN